MNFNIYKIKNIIKEIIEAKSDKEKYTVLENAVNCHLIGESVYNSIKSFIHTNSSKNMDNTTFLWLLEILIEEDNVKANLKTIYNIKIIQNIIVKIVKTKSDNKKYFILNDAFDSHLIGNNVYKKIKEHIFNNSSNNMKNTDFNLLLETLIKEDNTD